MSLISEVRALCAERTHEQTLTFRGRRVCFRDHMAEVE